MPSLQGAFGFGEVGEHIPQRVADFGQLLRQQFQRRARCFKRPVEPGHEPGAHPGDTFGDTGHKRGHPFPRITQIHVSERLLQDA